MKQEKATKQLTLGVEDKPIMREQIDANEPLYNLVDKYKRGLIIVPYHQRDKAWDREKKTNWIKRIKDLQPRPIGAIATYQLNNGHSTPTYLNDGLQRITASLEYFENSEMYGDNKEIA